MYSKKSVEVGVYICRILISIHTVWSLRFCLMICIIRSLLIRDNYIGLTQFKGKSILWT
jgi:hypothetical protein